jgi:signal transduction histidine kinase
MTAFKDLPIRTKLTRMSMVVSASVLLLSCAAFIGYELLTFKNTAAERLSTNAEIVGINATPALLFQDQRAATETLAALRATRNIVSAAVYTTEGNMFAKYVRSLGSDTAALPDKLNVTPSAHRIESGHLIVFKQMLSDGKPIGMVYIQSDLGEIESRLEGYAVIAFGVLTVSFIVALLVSSVLERKISGPILSLAETTKTIALEKDYSVRTAIESKDEIGILSASFNEMLRQIEERNETLQESIDEQKRTEEKVRQLNAGLEQRVAERTAELANAMQAKDRFLATMSHELRTPLNAILGFTGTLLLKLPGPLNADQEKQLRTVQTGAKHLLSLINDLLDVAKIEAEKVELDLAAVDCAKVIEEVAASLRPQAEAKGLEFTVTTPKQGLNARTDRRALSQIIINLVNNAIKFTERGSVRLRAERRAENASRVLEISVDDTGTGIRAEDQSKLFAAFSRVNAPGHEASEGTGLGLHLSRKLAEALGGTIELKSEYGKGSTFTLVLPER